MAFCKKCGAQIDDNAPFCSTCGASQTETAASPVTVNADEQDVRDNKAMGILAYIGILVLIPIFAAPKSRFARFHSNQGLVLFIISAALGILQLIVNILFPISFFGATNILRSIFSLIISLASIGVLVFMILGIVYAAQGQMKELPLIGSIRLYKH